MAGGCAWGQTTLISIENQFTRNLRPKISSSPLDPLLWIAWIGEGEIPTEMNGTDRDVWLRNVANGVPGGLLLASEHAMDGVSVDAMLSVDERNNVHVVWADNGDILSSGTDFDVYLRTWDGTEFMEMDPVSGESYAGVSDVQTNLINIERSQAPALVASQSQLFITWEDESDYDGDGVADSDILYLIR